MATSQALDLALLTFPHTEGAEHAYSDVRERAAGQPWLEEIAFVEHHGHDRLVLRGTVAGHYLDVDDHGDLIGPRAAKGAVTGAAVGLIFGPPGLAVGLTAGATTGAFSESDSAPRVHDVFFDEVRAAVPEGSSALVLVAAPEHVVQMAEAFAGKGMLARHHLTPEQADALLASLADDPAAA
jgi:uncharacterized membrane protein